MKKSSLLMILVCLAAWKVASMFTIPLFIPSPEVVFTTFMKMIYNGTLGQSLLSSFMRITAATLISTAVAIPLGLAAVSFAPVKNLLKPLISIFQYLPVTAFYPILIMFMGIGEVMKTSFIFFATFIFFLPTVIGVLEETNTEMLDTGKTMGMNRLQLITHVIMPSAMPKLLKNFLTMYGIGWTYIIIAEIVNTKDGLGHLLHIGSARGKTDMVFAALLTIILFSFLFDTLGNWLINARYKWYTEITLKGAEQADD